MTQHHDIQAALQGAHQQACARNLVRLSRAISDALDYLAEEDADRSDEEREETMLGATSLGGYRFYTWMGRESWQYVETHDGCESREQARTEAEAHRRAAVERPAEEDFPLYTTEEDKRIIRNESIAAASPCAEALRGVCRDIDDLRIAMNAADPSWSSEDIDDALRRLTLKTYSRVDTLAPASAPAEQSDEAGDEDEELGDLERWRAWAFRHVGPRRRCSDLREALDKRLAAAERPALASLPTEAVEAFLDHPNALSASQIGSMKRWLQDIVLGAAAERPHKLTWNGTEWVAPCGCRYHPDDDNGSHGGAPHVHRCETHLTAAERPQDAPCDHGFASHVARQIACPVACAICKMVITPPHPCESASLGYVTERPALEVNGATKIEELKPERDAMRDEIDRRGHEIELVRAALEPVFFDGLGAVWGATPEEVAACINGLREELTRLRAEQLAAAERPQHAKSMSPSAFDVVDAMVEAQGGAATVLSAAEQDAADRSSERSGELPEEDGET